jgi:membrane-associated phospholipid phosphatase
MAGIGMLLGTILVLIMLYGANLQVVFIVFVLAGGFLGTSRLILNIHNLQEVFTGFAIGFLLTTTILIVYVASLLTG